MDKGRKYVIPVLAACITLSFSLGVRADNPVMPIMKSMKSAYKGIKKKIKEEGLGGVLAKWEKLKKESGKLADLKVGRDQEEFSKLAGGLEKKIVQLDAYVEKNDEASFKAKIPVLKKSCVKCHKKFLGSFKRFFVDHSY